MIIDKVIELKGNLLKINILGVVDKHFKFNIYIQTTKERLVEEGSNGLV
jgi:hypothetical protein